MPILRVPVALSSSPYEVWIGDGILDHAGSAVREVFPSAARVAVISDDTVFGLYGERVLSALRAAGMEPVPIHFPAGESAKSLTQVEKICDAMIAARLDRSALVLALGGGVVGDLAGFVAAIYYRGIPFVQIPTTVVAQVDSAVGGKTGVNARGGKNLIGAFHQPGLVLADPLTLQSLADRDFNEGVAEIIKHAAIRNPDLLLELNPAQRTNLAPLIAENVRIKADIVAADERETLGLRAFLNFGHTIGHGIENAAGYGLLRHGEAISIGLHAAVILSQEIAGLPDADAARILDALEAFHLPLRIPDEIDPDAILSAMLTDKKFAAGKIRFVLLKRLGDPILSDQVTMEDIRRVIARLR